MSLEEKISLFKLVNYKLKIITVKVDLFRSLWADFLTWLHTLVRRTRFFNEKQCNRFMIVDYTLGIYAIFILFIFSHFIPF